MNEPPLLKFDRRNETGDEDVDGGDERDREPPWVPEPSQLADLSDLFRRSIVSVAVFGGGLLVAGTVLQLSSAWSRSTVLGLIILVGFACLFLLTVGTASGLRPILSACGAGVVEFVFQVSFWPGNPPLWSTVPIQGVGGAILIVGILQARKGALRDSEE